MKIRLLAKKNARKYIMAPFKGHDFYLKKLNFFMALHKIIKKRK